MASGLPCIVSDACGCAEDLVKPIRPDLCYPVGDISALQRAMGAGERQEATVNVVATVPTRLSEPVARFALTLSVKRRD